MEWSKEEWQEWKGLDITQSILQDLKEHRQRVLEDLGKDDKRIIEINEIIKLMEGE